MPNPADHTKPLGSGHAAAMGRLGLKELREVFNPARESIAQSELGLFGSPTPGEVAAMRSDERQGDVLEREEASSSAPDRRTSFIEQLRALGAAEQANAQNKCHGIEREGR